MSAIYIYMYLTSQDLDAIAVTTEPGLAPCLGIGLGYAKELVAESGCVVTKSLCQSPLSLLQLLHPPPPIIAL